jgi:hypothetical protein
MGLFFSKEGKGGGVVHVSITRPCFVVNQENALQWNAL